MTLGKAISAPLLALLAFAPSLAGAALVQVTNYTTSKDGGSSAKDGVIVTGEKAGSGYDFVYSGKADSLEGATVNAYADVHFAGLSDDGLSYAFSYAFRNASDYQGSLTTFGLNLFDTETGIALTEKEDFTFTGFGDEALPGTSDVEICLLAGDKGCSGNGLASGEGSEGKFAISFTKARDSFVLGGFSVYFDSQSLEEKKKQAEAAQAQGTQTGASGGSGGSVSDLGGAVSAAPEPMTWAMMIVGFLAVGGALRRRPGLRASAV
ncbi:cistern family PEP-CTERM protein [Sphingomonas sp. YR710]|uniref:cistern family PEP-CTERM protein n=1 Tax=Sphingomonas sp. YR710 TaxID=1882773 RepID=UPI00210A6755|nr:cistern family PEP-CTERM protein [Sphingomonas sp. YR710]